MLEIKWVVRMISSNILISHRKNGIRNKGCNLLKITELMRNCPVGKSLFQSVRPGRAFQR